MSLKSLAMIDHSTQRVVRLGKDLQSDHDILQEEFIRPIRTKDETPQHHDTMVPSKLDDPDQPPTHEQPSVLQLVKYKQNLRAQQDRRLHRKQLADLAEQTRAAEGFLHTDLMNKPDEVSQRIPHSDTNHTETHKSKAETSTKTSSWITRRRTIE